MSDTYSINKEVINTIFKKLVNPDDFIVKENIKNVQAILLKECSDSTIESIIHLMLSSTEYKSLKVGDHVKLSPPSYHVGSEYEIDILDDLGLLPKEPGYVYGIVKGDSSWSNKEPFDPFYSRIKVDCYYHCGEKKVKLYEHDINPLHCVKVSKSTISYFKQRPAAYTVVDPITINPSL
jgi:hypothetical protein|tara:strand:+ start:11449 stop:11985 length:537 start_codon:yes stop_codon:yes gene_type:complete